MKTMRTALLLLFATTLSAVADIDFNQLLDEQIAAERKELEERKHEDDSVAQHRADEAASAQWIRFMEVLKASDDNVLKAEFLKADYLFFIADRQFIIELPESPQEFRKATVEMAGYRAKLARVQAWLDANAPNPDAQADADAE